MNGDATGTHRIAEGLDVRGAPAWSPDGQWLAVAAANSEGDPQIFKIPIGGGSPVLLVKEYSTDPIWAPSGRFLVYSGADVGTTFSVQAVSTDGTPIPSEADAPRGARRLAFLGEDTLVIMKGDVSNKDFWASIFGPGESASSPDSDAASSSGISPYLQDGREIVFDRTREQSDIVLFDLHDR